MVAVAACSGGSSGAPSSLSLSGEQVPITQVTSAYSQMCTISSQAQSDAAATAAPFAGAEGGLNVLATVLAKDHGQESQRLLAALSTFQADILATPPSGTSGQAAANLLATAKQGLQALKITPPTC
jgi:hypothetical protein